MTPIEHFLTDIMQISLRDFIENSIADIGREVAPDWYFSADFFFKYARWPIMFSLRQRNFSCFGVAWKMYNVGRLCFFERAQPTFCFGRNWHVLIYSARQTLAHLGKKILFTDVDRKKCQSTSARKDDRSRLKRKHHRMTPIEHFLTDIVHISLRDWIENSIADIGREVAPTDIFQPTLRKFF